MVPTLSKAKPKGFRTRQGRRIGIRQTVVLRGMLLLLSVLLLGCAKKTSTIPFVPSDFVVPLRFEGTHFILRPIRASDAERDHTAVMASRESLREQFQSEWPKDDFTVEQNAKELAIHERQFTTGEAYVYTILDSSESTVLGCVYITPHESAENCAKIQYWISTDHQQSHPKFVSHFHHKLQVWINTAWPFEKFELSRPPASSPDPLLDISINSDAT